MFPLKQWLFRIFITKIFQVPVIWWAVGINLRQKSNLKYLPFLFSGKRILKTVRDTQSQQILKDAGIENNLLLDPVLSYENADNSHTKGKSIGISLRK